MTLKSVFYSLQEVFPQIDLRILKAVAIEHTDDADAAVEFVLSEVLPHISEPMETPYTLDNTHDTEHSVANLRLAAVEEARAAAEQERLEREDLAHEVLNEQVAVMGPIEQESGRLQQEAEENVRSSVDQKKIN